MHESAATSEERPTPQDRNGQTLRQLRPWTRCMAIRGLNKDFEDLGCARRILPCQNLRAAMRKLGLAAERPAPPAVALNKPGVVTPPPLLVPQASADAAAACTRRCGILGAALGASLSALVPADESDEVRAHVAAGAAAVASVALCAHAVRSARRGRAAGAPFVVAGTYTHELPDARPSAPSRRASRSRASSFGPL